MVCSLLSVTAIGLLLQRPLLGQVRVASRAAPPPRAALQMMSKDPSDVPPHEYQPQRACEVMFESLGLTYGDSGNGGRVNRENYEVALDTDGKTQLVLSAASKSSPYYGDATLVFRGTDPFHIDDIIRDIQYLTTSTKCFEENNDQFVSGDSGQVYGTTDGTGLPEALRSLLDNPTGPQVHRGFAKRTLRYSRWVQDKLRKNTDWGFEPDEPNKWNSGGISKLKILYIGGHSLGGAAALAFAYWVKLAFKDTNPGLKVHVYVFSAPNVGNAAWARDYNKKLGQTTFQHNYGPDVVPHYPPWLWKVGHVVNLEHKETHQFWPLTSQPSGDSCTDLSPKDMPAKDKRANFPLDYHLELHRVFVPYFEHLDEKGAQVNATVNAWKKYTTGGQAWQSESESEEKTKGWAFEDSEWGQKLMPSKLYPKYGKPDKTRKPHFTMDDIQATWSYPSDVTANDSPVKLLETSHELKNAALTVFNSGVLLYVLKEAVLVNAPLAFLMILSPAVAVFISLTVGQR